MKKQDCIIDEAERLADYRFRQFEENKPAIIVGGQLFFFGPRGLGTEDPDYSHWCTHDPETCEMIVLETGTTRARMKSCAGRKCNHPVGTCMLLPPDRCRHLDKG